MLQEVVPAMRQSRKLSSSPCRGQHSTAVAPASRTLHIAETDIMHDQGRGRVKQLADSLQTRHWPRM